MAKRAALDDKRRMCGACKDAPCAGRARRCVICNREARRQSYARNRKRHLTIQRANRDCRTAEEIAADNLRSRIAKALARGSLRRKACRCKNPEVTAIVLEPKAPVLRIIWACRACRPTLVGELRAAEPERLVRSLLLKLARHGAIALEPCEDCGCRAASPIAGDLNRPLRGLTWACRRHRPEVLADARKIHVASVSGERLRSDLSRLRDLFVQDPALASALAWQAASESPIYRLMRRPVSLESASALGNRDMTVALFRRWDAEGRLPFVAADRSATLDLTGWFKDARGRAVLVVPPAGE